MVISLIAAMGQNRVIGCKGGLPWHIPGELNLFKQKTMGKPIVMGRKTWESLGGILPGRPHIVITRDRSYHAEGVHVDAFFGGPFLEGLFHTARLHTV